MTLRKALTWIAVGLLAGMMAVGCSHREHLTPSHGDSYTAFFKHQVINPDAGKNAAAPGLDSQEAAVVAKGYLNSLTPDSTGASTAQQQPILLVAPEQSKGKPRRR
ncbi:hypothetical protein ACFL6C_04505 [Myxococcota bacterium]